MTARLHGIATLLVTLILVASLYLLGQTGRENVLPESLLVVRPTPARVENLATPAVLSQPIPIQVLTPALTQTLAPTAVGARVKDQPSARDPLLPPRLAARAWLAVRASADGRWQTLTESGSRETLPIASLTKLITAIVVAEHYPPEVAVAVVDPLPPSASGDAASNAGDGFSTTPEFFSLDSALRLLLISSSNATADALGEPVGREQFVAWMNETATRLDLAHTGFINPSGLDPATDGLPNYSTAQDIARLAWQMINRYPEILRITRTPLTRVSTLDNGKTYRLASTNQFLNIATDWPTEIVGGKTGQTELAKKNLLLILRDRRSGDYLINVVLGADDHFAAMKQLVDWAHSSKL